jgi:hypothetical protein
VTVLGDDRVRVELDQGEREPLRTNGPRDDAVPDPLGRERVGVVESAQAQPMDVQGVLPIFLLTPETYFATS